MNSDDDELPKGSQIARVAKNCDKTTLIKIKLKAAFWTSRNIIFYEKCIFYGSY